MDSESVAFPGAPSGRCADLESALRGALAVIEDYLGYRHDGDPDREDARLMGEMEIDDYGRDGRLERAKRLLASASAA